MTIWELRNPKIAQLSAKEFYKFHCKSGIAEKINEISPLDRNSLGIDKAINEWGPAVEAKIKKIMTKLETATIPDDQKKVISDCCQRTME